MTRSKLMSNFDENQYHIIRKISQKEIAVY